MGIVYGVLKMLGVPPAKSCYSRAPIVFDRSCTGGVNRTCRLVRQLSAWNELLWQCGLQLHESPEELGRLCLTAVASWQPPIDGQHKWQRQAAALVLHLMSVHQCVAEFHVTESLLVANCVISCIAVRCASSELRRLVVRSIPHHGHRRNRCVMVFGHVLASMTQLEKFAYQDRRCPSAIVRPLCNLVRRSRRLRSLDVSAVAPLRADLSAELVQALASNSTITELFLSTKVMIRAEALTREAMADYLRYNRNLRKLVFVAPSKQEVDVMELRSLVQPLFDTEVLEELHLSIGALSAEGFEVIAELIARNNSLRVLFVRWSDSVEGDHCSCVGQQWTARGDKQKFSQSTAREQNATPPSRRVIEFQNSSWARAFAGNQTLLELALDMSQLKSSRCEAFFRALAASGTLKKVCVVGIPMKRLRKVLRVIRDAGTTLPKIHVGDTHVSSMEVETLNEFEQVSRMTVHSSNATRIHKALHDARDLLHVTHLRLFLHTADFDHTSHLLLAQFLQGNRTLRWLELVGHNYAPREDQADVVLVRALAANKSLRSLNLTDLTFCSKALELLASAVRCSQGLFEFAFYPTEPQSAQYFLVCLAPGFSTNRALVRLDLPGDSDKNFERFRVEDVVRRNAMLVARAARFVTGASKERYCAEAFEPVARNYALVEMVRWLDSLPSDSDAEMMIRETRHGLREMKDFLRVSGVVKESVVCIKRRDSRLQLGDLNSDCLRQIRQFLTLADIAVASPDGDLVH